MSGLAASILPGENPENQIVARSTTMRELVKTARQVAKFDCTILLLGESGTGKELLAKLIHDQSGRTGRLVKVNCAAIPENLLESELFGYDHGAFTGAKREGSPGKFEQAQQGTILLDEIGDLPLHLQAKLLRFYRKRKSPASAAQSPARLMSG